MGVSNYLSSLYDSMLDFLNVNMEAQQKAENLLEGRYLFWRYSTWLPNHVVKGVLSIVSEQGILRANVSQRASGMRDQNQLSVSLRPMAAEIGAGGAQLGLATSGEENESLGFLVRQAGGRIMLFLRQRPSSDLRVRPGSFADLA